MDNLRTGFEAAEYNSIRNGWAANLQNAVGQGGLFWQSLWEASTKSAAQEATAALSEYNNIQASMRTASWAENDLSDPRQIQRIVADQNKAREAEQKLNQALE